MINTGWGSPYLGLWFSICHSQLLIEWTKLKHDVKSLRNENRKLQREQVVLQESWKEAKRLCEEAREKIFCPCVKQQQVG